MRYEPRNISVFPVTVPGAGYPLKSAKPPKSKMACNMLAIWLTISCLGNENRSAILPINKTKIIVKLAQEYLHLLCDTEAFG
jgi:hypothetical protein